VHRDAETAPSEDRVREIHAALEESKGQVRWGRDVTVCVIPVRMTEAWLLLDENALRLAAGNPSGKDPLDLPPIHRLEQLPNPKATLHDLLRQAGGLSGRRLKSFRVRSAVQRITEMIEDFSPLRALTAFQALETEVRQVVGKQKWA
jgi:hypothetical protein